MSLKSLSSTLAILLGIVLVVYSNQTQVQQNKKTITQYKYLIFTEKCFNEFFINSNWFNFQCLKTTAIKLLGYSLVLGGAIIKFPQILKVIKLKSVEGISFTAVILQVTTNILATGYCIYKGNTFSLYGENVFIGIQMLLIILLFVFFGNGNKIVYFFFFFLMIGISYYVSDPHHLPPFIVEHSIIVQTILLCASRFSQIMQVHKLKSTRSLAILTWGLTVCGNMARITTIVFQAANDWKFLVSLICVASLNIYIVFQFYLYRNNKQIQKENETKNQTSPKKRQIKAKRQ